MDESGSIKGRDVYRKSKKMQIQKTFFWQNLKLYSFLILAHSVKRGGKARKNFSDCIYFHGSLARVCPHFWPLFARLYTTAQ